MRHMRQLIKFLTEEQKGHKGFALFVLMYLCLNTLTASAEETPNSRQAKRVFNTA